MAEANSDGVEPIEECCVCPEISSPAATTQQRETGEQILVLKAVALPVFIDIGPDTISSDRIRELPGDSPPKISAPPLYVRLLTFRI